MNKRERLIKLLTEEYMKYEGEFRVNTFTSSPSYKKIFFDEVKKITDSDLDKVIEMYDKKSNGNWQMNDRLLLLECLYSVIKDNSNYSLICDKLLDVYKVELDNSLLYNVKYYDDFKFVETDEIEKHSYVSKKEKSMLLIDMCLKSIENAQVYSQNNVESLKQIKKAVSIYDSVKRDFDKSNQPIPLQINDYINSVNEKIAILEEKNRRIEETERQQKEIELINLQQEINKMENEQLEIKKRITEIRMQTMGHIFSKRMSEQYPDEFAEIQKYSEQLSNLSSRSSQQIIDLRKRFDKVSSDLQLYKNALPVYENYYQRYNQYHQEKHSKRNDNEQLNNYTTNNAGVIDNGQTNITVNNNASKSNYVSEIINLLDSNEREFMPDDIEDRLNKMPVTELQKLLVSKSERDENLIPPAQRNRLIGIALMKTDGYDKFSVREKQQMINQLQSYTNEQLLNYISNQDLKKNNSLKDENEVNMQMPTNNSSEYPDDLYIRNDKVVNFINSNYSQYGTVDKILSTRGYPDSIYEVRFNNGETREITVPHEVEFASPSTIFGEETYKKNEGADKKENINSEKNAQKDFIDIQSIVKQINELNPNINTISANGTFEYDGKYRVKARDSFGRNTSIEISKELYDELNEYFKQNPREISTVILNQNKNQRNQESQDSNVNTETEKESDIKKDQIIQQIIKAMLDAGEFSNSGLDIGTKTQDVQYIRNRLQTMDIEVLKSMLLDYSNTLGGLDNQNIEEVSSKHR